MAASSSRMPFRFDQAAAVEHERGRCVPLFAYGRNSARFGGSSMPLPTTRIRSWQAG